MHRPVFELLVFVVEVAVSLEPYFVQKNTTFFLENPQSQIVSKNSSVTFHCKTNIQPTNFSSYPQLDITWWKDGTEVQNSRKITTKTYAGYSQLQIFNVDLDRIGKYQCVVRDGPAYDSSEPCAKSSSFSRWLFLTVSLPAYLNIVGELEDAIRSEQISIVANLGQPLLLHCSSGQRLDHPDYVEWRFNGASLFPSNVSKIGRIIAGRNFLVQNMTDIATGNYSCIATWFSDRAVGALTYIVTIKKDLYNGTSLITIDQPKIAISGNKYELICYTSPDAKAAVVWLKNGTNIFSYNHTLVFNNISTYDSGSYTCKFDQEYSISQSVTVEVFVPPAFLTNDPKDIYLPQGTTNLATLINCPVAGFPEPSIILYKNGTPLSVTSIKATTADYGIYQCFANNSAGVSIQIIRALRQDTYNAPINIRCSTTMMSKPLFKISITWDIPAYFSPPNLIKYQIYFCSGQNQPTYKNQTTDTYYHLQLDALEVNTVYVSSIYDSRAGSSQTAPSICQVPQPDQLSSTCNIWKYCFNENQTLVEPSWTCLGGIGIENDTFSAGSGALCVYGRNMTILEERFDLSVKFCGSNSIIETNKLSGADHLQISLNCSNVSQVILSWQSLYPALYDITIYGICRNLSYEQKVTKYFNQSTSGKYIVESSSSLICAFRVHYKNGLESLSSTLHYCYYQHSTDVFVSESFNCSSSSANYVLPAHDILKFAPFAAFVTILIVVALIVAIIIILKRKLTNASFNMVIKLAAPSKWDIALSDINLKTSDCSSVVTNIDDLCYASNSISNEVIDSMDTWQCGAFGSCSSDNLSDPYQLPSCDTSASNYGTQL